MENKNSKMHKIKKINSNISNLNSDLNFKNLDLGHNSIKLQKSWHGYLSKTFLGSRNKTVIFNSDFTFKYLIKAMSVFIAILKSNGTILIINTNPELSNLVYNVKKNVNSPNVFFNDCGYTNGTLTNWAKVYTKVNTFLNFYQYFDSFLNINNIHFPNYKKMKKNYKGFLKRKQHTKDNYVIFKKNKTNKNEIKKLSLNWRPDVLILLNTENNQSIIKEAYNLKIPIIALVDSNFTISDITYPIPTNTYSYSFVSFFCNLITKLMNKSVGQ